MLERRARRGIVVFVFGDQQAARRRERDRERAGLRVHGVEVVLRGGLVTGDGRWPERRDHRRGIVGWSDRLGDVVSRVLSAPEVGTGRGPAPRALSRLLSGRLSIRSFSTSG